MSGFGDVIRFGDDERGAFVAVRFRSPTDRPGQVPGDYWRLYGSLDELRLARETIFAFTDVTEAEYASAVEWFEVFREAKLTATLGPVASDEEMTERVRRSRERLAAVMAEKPGPFLPGAVNALLFEQGAILARRMAAIRDSRACPECGAPAGTYCAPEDDLPSRSRPTIHRARMCDGDHPDPPCADPECWRRP